MSEERTPIEELIEELNEWNDIEWDVYSRLFDTVQAHIESDKAYREKHKHTKEDVIEAYIEGIIGVHTMNEIETWYNETYNK